MPLGEMLSELGRQKALVDIRRDTLDVSDIRGMILQVSESLILIGVVSDAIRRDGFTIVAREDVSFLRWGTGVLRGWKRVLDARGGEDETVPGLDLADWGRAIATGRAHTPLLTFHRERIDPRTCYLSDEFEATGDSIVGVQITHGWGARRLVRAQDDRPHTN